MNRMVIVAHRGNRMSLSVEPRRLAGEPYDNVAEERTMSHEERAEVNEAVTEYIASVGGKAGQEWEALVCDELRAMTLAALPGVEERMQYGKPHYLLNKKYVAVIGTAKQHVSYTIFKAAELDPPAGLFEDGPPERRTIKIKNGQTVDYAQLAALLKQATATIG